MNTSQPHLDVLLSHRDFVRKLARRLLVCPDDVDEVEQRAWISGWRTQSEIRSARTWLQRVVRHHALDVVRSRSRAVRREARGARDDVQPAVDEHLANVELAQRLVDAVLQLDLPERSAILACFYEGLSQRRAARHLGITRDVLRTRLARGLTRLRSILTKPESPTAKRSLTLTMLAPLARARRPVSWFQTVCAIGCLTMALTGSIIGLSTNAASPSPAPRANLQSTTATDVQHGSPQSIGVLERTTPIDPRANHDEIVLFIVDPEGAPIEGARVVRLERMRTGWTGTTDAPLATASREGIVRTAWSRWSELRPGSQFVVVHPGFVERVLPNLDRPGDHRVVLQRGQEVRVRCVTSQRRPIEDVRIQFSATGLRAPDTVREQRGLGPHAIHVTTTDANGWATFRSLEPIHSGAGPTIGPRFRVEARHPHYAWLDSSPDGPLTLDPECATTTFTWTFEELAILAVETDSELASGSFEEEVDDTPERSRVDTPRVARACRTLERDLRRRYPRAIVHVVPASIASPMGVDLETLDDRRARARLTLVPARQFVAPQFLPATSSTQAKTLRRTTVRVTTHVGTEVFGLGVALKALGPNADRSLYALRSGSPQLVSPGRYEIELRMPNGPMPSIPHATIDARPEDAWVDVTLPETLCAVTWNVAIPFEANARATCVVRAETLRAPRRLHLDIENGHATTGPWVLPQGDVELDLEIDGLAFEPIRVPLEASVHERNVTFTLRR